MDTSLDYRNLMRSGFYAAVVVSLVLLLTGWWNGSITTLATMDDRMIAIGRLFGLLAGWSVALEIILMSRIPFIERSFDLQEIVDLHRLNGYSLLFTISAHLAFLLVGYADPSHLSLWSQFWAFNSSQYEDVLWATLGTLIFFGAGALSVRLIQARIRYEVWYLTHLAIYFGIVLTFLHEIKLGGDFISVFWFTSYWYALYILAFMLWAWYRLLHPFGLMIKYRFQVVRVEKAAKNTYSIILKGHRLQEFAYEPGQYATWRFLTPDLWYEAHPFSISSSPGTNYLRFTVKASADLMQRIIKIKVGSYVMVDGPRGNFTAVRAAETSNVVLIAGGIGITPYIATMRQFLGQGKKVSLLYAVRSYDDIAFVEELRQLEAAGLSISLFVDQQGQRITVDVLEQFARADTTIYVCGPDGMSRSLVKSLKGFGVAKESIITERFAY
jgi:predicted ferric reductase